MDIIITVPPICTQNEFCKMINKCMKNSIRYYRFNLSKNFLSLEDVLDITKKCKYIYQCDLNSKIIFDLPYPRRKVRIFFNKYKMNVRAGDRIVCSNKKGDEIYIDVTNLQQHFTLGKKYYYQDGEGELFVRKIDQEEVCFICVNSFEMKSGKGIVSDRLVDGQFDSKILKMIEIIKPNQIWFSFVEDILFIKTIKKHINSKVKLYMKIESKEGYINLDSILWEECGIVVARGDLGLNADMEELLYLQENIVSSSKKYNKSVYIAGDFLKSMVHNRFPSRADLIDTLYAVKLGCDGIMLNAPIMHSQYFDEIIKVIGRCITQ